jgi:hypothetical protein
MNIYATVQRACEQRLAAAQEVQWAQDNGEEVPAEAQLAGPFCGCDTCVIREVLDAARPYFAELAMVEMQLPATATAFAAWTDADRANAR